ncbi:hypothetical protein COY91_03215 [Candidatus Shapirobacteria bacterium CG_4_10_14_0_8_um_filter_39_15]|nr:MAG: hypothetical protein COY91_03215 [Candidatus Shapirobacteria bacterium CG_4_10_14_0_8_um_filter_39_15]
MVKRGLLFSGSQGIITKRVSEYSPSGSWETSHTQISFAPAELSKFIKSKGSCLFVKRLLARGFGLGLLANQESASFDKFSPSSFDNILRSA